MLKGGIIGTRKREACLCDAQARPVAARGGICWTEKPGEDIQRSLTSLYKSWALLSTSRQDTLMNYLRNLQGKVLFLPSLQARRLKYRIVH